MKADDIKNWVLIIGAVGGMSSGLYSVIAKPIQETTKLTALEGKMSEILPQIQNHEVNIAVLNSRLSKIDESQDKILNAILEVKKKL